MLAKINHSVEYFYRKFSTFNPFAIAERLNIQVRYVNFEQKPLGEYTKILGDKLILLDWSLRDSNLKYVVCSHELFHATDHEDISSYYSLGDKQRSRLEYEANLFTSVIILNLYTEIHSELPKSFEDLKYEFLLSESYREFFF